MFTRWDYIGRDHAFCHECGDHFISDREQDTFCAGCVRSICYEPWNHAFDMYRALRNDEDVPPCGPVVLRSSDQNANVSVAVHVEEGSTIPTQYISLTGSIEVAAFFAAKGYHERGQTNARIAVMDVPHDFCVKYYALNSIPHGFWTARNYARRFDEYVLTDEKAEKEVTFDRVLHLSNHLLEEFQGQTANFATFQTPFQGSDLRRAIHACLKTTRLNVTFDLVGLHHYADQRPNPLQRIRLVLEDENPHDTAAIRVEGARNDRDWHCIGYLASEHAPVCRHILKHSNNRYIAMDLPILVGRVYETSIKLAFDVPSHKVNPIEDYIIDSCGRVGEERHYTVG